MMKQFLHKGVALVLVVFLLNAFAMPLNAVDDTQWQQLYFKNVQAASNYVSNWEAAQGYNSNNSPSLFGTSIMDITLADLNFDGTPELLYAENLPAGAGNNIVYILAISEGKVSQLAYYEVPYGKNYFPILSSDVAGNLVYTITACIGYETSFGMDYKEQVYLFNSSTTLDKNILDNSQVKASALKTYTSVNYEQTTMGQSISGVGYQEIKKTNYTDAEITAMMEAYVVETKLANSNHFGITVTLNGEKINFDQPPIIDNDRTLVPIRAIVEAMGASVDWDAGTQTATIRLNDLVVLITIGSNIMYTNGNAMQLDVPAKIVGNRTFVPIRAVAEAFGATVTWDNNTRTIIINYTERSI